MAVKKKVQNHSSLNKVEVYFSLMWQPECEQSGADIVAPEPPGFFCLVLPALAYSSHFTIRDSPSASHIITSTS